jgi:hypothetical protein
VTDMAILKLCAIMATWSHNTPDGRAKARRVCVDVGVMAKRYDVDVTSALALAWSESRFTVDNTSGKGAKGALQVIPKWWCEDRHDCDYTEAGIKALKAFSRLYPKSFVDTVCHYNSGTEKECNSRSVSFAMYVDDLRDKVRRTARSIK